MEINQTTKALASFLHMAESIAALSFDFQEKRRAERAEQQRIRAEKDKERQARREVRSSCSCQIHLLQIPISSHLQ